MSEEVEQIDQIESHTVGSTKSVKKSSENKMDFGAIEVLYEKNKKAITYGGGALLAIVAIFSFYTMYWLPGEEKEASNESFFAQNYFEKDSFLVALNGGLNVQTADGPKTMFGFKVIARQKQVIWQIIMLVFVYYVLVNLKKPLSF
jgi:hypothetical protein